MVYTLLGRNEYWTPLSTLISANEIVLEGTGKRNSRRESDTQSPVRKKPPATTWLFSTTAS